LPVESCGPGGYIPQTRNFLMDLSALIRTAKEQGASDLHLEPSLPAAIRVRGALRTLGEPIGGAALLEAARQLIGQEHWGEFIERRSYDQSRIVGGVRCRINVLQTARGVGMAIRLLTAFQATIERLNLHPDLRKLVARSHGLILVSGPTGSGKSSTLAALIQEINLTEARHILTVESPIEYVFRPVRAFIRQREVGRDTPSFDQALLDALHEDPDVLMVGEMRDPETMRLTLNASETGHLVVATVHSSSCVEAVQRLVGAFPAEIQSNVAAQIADCLVGVISQRLRFRHDIQIRVPECEILIPNNAANAFIRNRDFFKIMSVMETGADHGMWTFERYRSWLEKKTDWHLPAREPEDLEPDLPESPQLPAVPMPHATASKKASKTAQPNPAPLTPASPGGRIEIEPVESPFGKILKRSTEDEG
jgi:twitching motility protein PilT